MDPQRTTPRHALDRGFELAELVVCLLLVGVGLTSLVMVVTSEGSGPQQAEQTMSLLGAAASEHDPPGEVLVGGVGLESVVVEGAAWDERPGGLEDARFRLVSHDTVPQLSSGRYWVVGLFGKLPERPPEYEAERIGEADGLVLERWERSGPVGYRLLEQLVTVRAAFTPVEGEGPERRCTQSRFGQLERLYCGPNSWNWVGPEQVPVNKEQSWCVWAHPLRDHELRITFPEVPLGQGPLQGRYALTDFAADTPGGSPVTFKVLVDGEEAINRLTPNRRGWHRYRVPGRGEEGDVAEVTFVVTSPNDGRRHFCFDGEIGGRP